jgi:hypothetical protein
MTLEIIAGADYNRANGTDYKTVPAVLINIVCELGEAKSVPACGEAKSAPTFAGTR